MASTPAIPDLPPPVRQPVPDDASALAAKRKAATDLLAQQGRDATDLTGAGHRGGTDTAGTVLGN